MADKLTLQKDTLKALGDYSDNIILGTETLVEELRGTEKDDTDELFNLVITGINWEIEVFNNCEELINKDEMLVDKSKMAGAVSRLGKVLKEKDNIKVAACLSVDFIPFLKAMKVASAKLV
ncbi:MAG: hypothetical protein ACI4D8_03260 [Wujia sp.]